MKKFLRRVWSRYSKLGRNRKKKQKWRRPTGRDNKMREGRKGYASRVRVGYEGDKKIRGVVKEKMPKIVRNINDLKNISGNYLPIIGRVGKKKKIEILKIAEEKKIKIYNINPNKFLKKIEREKKK